MTPVPQVKPTYVDDPQAPEIFASFINGIAFDGPNARMTFACSRVNHENTPGNVSTVVNLRLVMSIDSAINMADFIKRFLETAALSQASKPADQSLQ